MRIQDLRIRYGLCTCTPNSSSTAAPPAHNSNRQVILYTHGAGWVFGNAHTHDRLVRELTTRAGAATIFTNYTRSPEAKYPTAIEEIYAVLEWIGDYGADNQLDPSRIAVAGDLVGGNMTAAITLMAKHRGGPRSGQKSPPRRFEQPSTNYPDFRKHSSLSARRTCCGMKVRRTPPNCAKPE